MIAATRNILVSGESRESGRAGPSIVAVACNYRDPASQGPGLP
jgi:hypothetical protein